MGQCMSRQEMAGASLSRGSSKSREVSDRLPRRRLQKMFRLVVKTTSESATDDHDEDVRYVVSPAGTTGLTEGTLTPMLQATSSRHWHSPVGGYEEDSSSDENSSSGDEEVEEELVSLTGSFGDDSGPIIRRVKSKKGNETTAALHKVSVFCPDGEVIEEEEDPGAPSDEEDFHEEAEKMEPGRLVPVHFPRSRKPPPRPLVTSADAVVLSGAAATAGESGESLHPMQFSQFQKLKLQADVVASHNKEQHRMSKVEDRMQDVQGYRKLWKEYEEIKKMDDPATESRPKAKRSNSFDLQNTNSWFFNFGYPEYDLEQRVEGEPDYYDVHDSKSQASLSLLTETSMDAQRRLFAEKRRMRMKSSRGTPKQAVVDSTPLRTTPRPDYGPSSDPVGEMMEVSFRSPNEEDEATGADDASSVVSDLADDTSASTINRNDYGVFRQFRGAGGQGTVRAEEIEVTFEPAAEDGLTVIGLAKSQPVGSQLPQAMTLNDKFTAAVSDAGAGQPSQTGHVVVEATDCQEEKKTEDTEADDAQPQLWTPRPHPATNISNYSSIYGMSTEDFFLQYAEESPLMANWEEARRRSEDPLTKDSSGQTQEHIVVTPSEPDSDAETRMARLVESRKRNRVQLELLRRYGDETDANKSLLLADRVAKQVNDVLTKYRESECTVAGGENNQNSNQATQTATITP